MDPEYKLQVSLQLTEELAKLIEGNEYEMFFTQHIIPIKIELERQLTIIQYHSKIQK